MSCQDQTFKAVGVDPLGQKKAYSQYDPLGKPDPKKTQEKNTNSVANLKNGHQAGKPASELNGQKNPARSQIRDDLCGLQRQIESFRKNDQLDIRLRYQSEAFILHKRRNNLFRGFQKKPETQDFETKQERLNLFDSNINHKKPANKNSIKIQKFLNSFITRGYDSLPVGTFLEFISSKHKIPIELHQKMLKTHHGFRQSDVRKIKKYQLRMNAMPPLGNNLEHEKKEVEESTEEEHLSRNNFTEIEDGDYFEEIPSSEEGYIIPSQEVPNFAQNKRDIFKAARCMARYRLEKEAVLKKLAYHCVKEVQKRYSRCVRNQNDYISRAKKLQRECIVYWRKREKQLTQIKKKKEKIEGQLKKRDEEQQEAKKQQKRLQYIMYQSGLYSHFMATKLGVEGDPKKESQKLAPIGDKPLDIDEQAAMLNVNQIITNRQENLQRFGKKKQDKLDLSSVDQGKLELVGAPSSFVGTLKQYQIKGLRWLNNLHEQGINGILADEMGLGKTIQAIALLAHISQTKNVWGPFLVIAPNSTLYNWQQQFKRFCPSMKVLPYWGNIKQRKTIRKFFSSKKFTEKADSPFHVVITSYQLTVTDDKTFKRLKWQFMILDEAQAIKNIMSQRWNTLKEFQSRNRLLLTGTPIQNNMAELWALLNFVMPDLFDSHELFNEWFSKDIQAHSQDAKELDQIKIQRLHAILKPFMLRRIKKDVEHEIGKKYEHQVLCEMTKRQKLLYESIKDRLNLKELFKMLESKAKVDNLMNLVMQLRKVCNHPELFERRPARSPFLFQQIYYYTGCIPIRAGDIKLLSFSSKNPIQYKLPVLVYDELMKYPENHSKKCRRLVNIFTVDNMRKSKSFSIFALINLSLGEVQKCFEQDLMLSKLLLVHWWQRQKYSRTLSTKQYLNMEFKEPKWKIDFFETRFINNSFIENATSPTITPTVSSVHFNQNFELLNNNTYQKYIFEGRYASQYSSILPEKISTDYKGVLNNINSLTPIDVVNFGSLVGDSSKLKHLDKILKEKKRNGDKVLIFCQMTKMIDILEDFMNHRKYSFFRLDGACNIADRRDMVNDFQKPNSRVFIFLLSTRAGGLGVTLTAANTVIFYDNDWNPTMDAQATDRAHRIGQSRDVNVYQLVTKATIEERIVKRAQQKKTVQSTVYEGASFNFFKKQMIQLMVDEFDVNGDEKVKKDGRQQRKKGQKVAKGKQEKANTEKPTGSIEPNLSKD